VVLQIYFVSDCITCIVLCFVLYSMYCLNFIESFVGIVFYYTIHVVLYCLYCNVFGIVISCKVVYFELYVWYGVFLFSFVLYFIFYCNVC